MKIIAVNNTGDILLWQHAGDKRTIRTSDGSIIVQGKSSYVTERWETFKET